MATEPTMAEDAARAHDRHRVIVARSRHQWGRLFWVLMGPGILVMLGENDAPSMLSYAATGARFGIGPMIPFVIVTFAMAWVVQEITVRLGTATQSGHAELIYRRFGRFWGNFALIDLMATNFMTLVTEFVGIVAGSSYFGISPAWAVFGAILIICGTLIFRRYWSWERTLLAIAAFNLVFVAIVIFHWRFFTALPHAPWWGPVAGGWHKQNLTILLADIGATITPWMLFFQQGAVADKGMMTGDVGAGRWDTALGAFLASLSAVACIMITASLFHRPMGTAQFGAAQFAQALTPVIGRLGATLFALGIIEAGLVAATTIAVSSGYTFGEIRQKPHSLNRPLQEAPGFYLTLFAMVSVAGLCVLLPHFPLEAVVLLVNVAAVLTMPPAMGFLLILANDREIMGSQRSTLFLNVLGIGVGLLVSIAGIFYALAILFPGL